MKKSLIGILVAAVFTTVTFGAMGAVGSFGAIAKGSSHVESKDSVINNNTDCMIQVNDANANRYVNVTYIRSVEIVYADNPKMVTIRMASNYGNKSNYSILYQTEESAKQASKDFVMKINNCKN